MEKHETVVIGAGQAGLAVGYHLRRRGIEFVILDAQERTGDGWRRRWDSLRLFSPGRYDGLDGMRFPARASIAPTKDEMADYLEAYARRFDLPVRHGARVERVSRDGDAFTVSAPGLTLRAANVVVAMGPNQVPRIPPFADGLSPDILSMHSSEYRNPAQLRNGPVLLVGLGNSGAEIALDTAGTHPTIVAGKESWVVPWRIDAFLFRMLGIRLLRFAAHHVLTVRTAPGRRLRDRAGAQGTQLVRVKPSDLVDAGVTRVARITAIRDGLPETQDGRVLDVPNVIWCTGYRPGFTWIDLPVFGEGGRPAHELGVVPGVPGLYFVGLPFVYSLSSALVTGVSRDAKRVARHITQRARSSGARPGRRTID